MRLHIHLGRMRPRLRSQYPGILILQDEAKVERKANHIVCWLNVKSLDFFSTLASSCKKKYRGAGTANMDTFRHKQIWMRI